MAAATDITTEARGLMPYQPIENHGIIGNMRTAALVGLNGSIDWLCFPRFDSPSVFAAILDDKKGGYFKIAPIGDEIVHKQLYWPGTNVLITRFLSTDDQVVFDASPCRARKEET
jgi:GH15 family glucan-1,4-alpha-glucosidase